MQNKKWLRGVALLNCFVDTLYDDVMIFCAIKMKSVCPVVTCSWDIVDDIVEKLSNITFKDLICDAFLHIH